MRKSILSCTLASTLVLSSCATIISGSKQNVKINSNPTVATVFVDGGEQGKTPLEIKLKRNSDHKIALVLEGYKPYDVNLTRKPMAGCGETSFWGFDRFDCRHVYWFDISFVA